MLPAQATTTDGTVPPTTQSEVANGQIQPAWLGYGPRTQYPAEGGTWEYGFWDAKVRSYYTVGRCHGSTVRMDNRKNESIRTRANKKSIAQLAAVQYPGAKDRYNYWLCK
ncbi:MAG: hypothetical protein E7Z96_07020 [Actinomycetaceae bacterium]|nr:hypothetical protein [Actinomycetaceae bacterium]